jgi:drug/metabolite transporter (DMT)-like permease
MGEVRLKGKYKITTVMLIFGSIGIFVKGIHLSSSEIAFLRGVIGSLFLIFASLFAKQKLSFHLIKENLLLLIFSGAAIGFNWILLFEAYRYTTISNATLSYYFAPVFVMILAPFVLKEKLTPVKAGCILAAMAGLFLVIHIGGTSPGTTYNHPLGILYGLLAAVLYASVILMNKFIKNLTGFETTLIQLLISAFVLLPYVMIRDQFHFSGLDSKSVLLIVIVGIVHTGFAYFWYFGSVKELNGQTIAVFSYIDPISAVIMAAVFLGESMSVIQMIGGALILGSTFVSEKFDSKPHSKNELVEE